MTDTITPAEGAPKGFPTLLWSDTKIDRLALDKLSYNGVMTLFTAKEIMRIMRDDYERILASLRYELAERDEQIANLPRQLQDSGWEVTDREITINAMRARLAGEPATFDALGRYLYGEQEANNANQ